MIRIHVCISGFTQSAKRVHGVFRLNERLHQEGYNNCISRVLLRPWNADWDELAESIWAIGEEHDQPVVVNIYSYSYGVGWGTVRLCEQLKRRGIPVHCVVASDGVFRHPNPLLRWTSLVRRDLSFSPVIRIPSNVRFVIPFHQTQNRPQGHKIVRGKGCTAAIAKSGPLDFDHQYMDDAPEFHDAAIAAALALKAVVE